MRNTAATSAVPDPFAEIRHEVGNYFHKLYFLAEQLAASGAGPAEPAPDGDELTATLRRLEAFLALAHELSRPLTLSASLMPVGDAVAGLAALARGGDARDVTVTAPADWDGAALAVDTVQLPAAFRALIAAATAAAAVLRFDATPAVRDDRAGVEMLVTPATPPTGDAPADAIVRWAVADRIVASHGGALWAVSGTPPAVALFLPFHP